MSSPGPGRRCWAARRRTACWRCRRARWQRLETYTPAWPLPKIFRLTSKGKLTEGIFKGETINTPSMLCVEDALDGLRWAESIGGLPALIARCEANLASHRRLGRSAATGSASWPRTPATRSCTSICLKIDRPLVHRAADRGAGQGGEATSPRCWKSKASPTTSARYRDAPPGLRIWAGATVETADIEALLPWLDWAYATARSSTRQQRHSASFTTSRCHRRKRGSPEHEARQQVNALRERHRHLLCDRDSFVTSFLRVNAACDDRLRS